MCFLTKYYIWYTVDNKYNVTHPNMKRAVNSRAHFSGTLTLPATAALLPDTESMIHPKRQIKTLSRYNQNC